MSYEFVIEQDVPLPPKHIGTAPRPPKYPFAEMSVGESFAVPLGEEKAGSNYVLQPTSRSGTPLKRLSLLCVHFMMKVW